MATTFGDEVHSDVWGPSQISSLGRCKYYITFTDDHTRFTQLMLMPLLTKDEALHLQDVCSLGIHLTRGENQAPQVGPWGGVHW